jgi:hypothetical protein
MNQDTNQDPQDETRDGQDEDGFCKKIWSNYRELVKIKQSLDLKIQKRSSILEIKDEIKSCRDRTVEFYNLFGLKAVDDFFELVRKERPSLIRSRKIADFMPALFLYLDASQIEIFKEKIEKSKLVLAKDYLNLQLAFYDNNGAKFKELILAHIDKFNNNSRTNDYNYPFDKIQLFGQAVRFRELFNDEEKEKIANFLNLDYAGLSHEEDTDKTPKTIITSLKQRLNDIFKDGRMINEDRLNNILLTLNQITNGSLDFNNLTTEYSEYEHNLEHIYQSLVIEFLVQLWRTNIKQNKLPEDFQIKDFQKQISLLFFDLFKNYREKLNYQINNQSNIHYNEKNFLFYSTKLHHLIFLLKQNHLLKDFSSDKILKNSSLKLTMNFYLSDEMFVELFTNRPTILDQTTEKHNDNLPSFPNSIVFKSSPLDEYLKNKKDTSGLFDLNKMNYANVIGLLQFNRERRMRLTKH